MKNKNLNKKGFTLIELLAVIVILAILMTLAITSMSGIISNAKKDTFVTTALQYSNAIRFKVINGDIAAPGTGNCIVVSTKTVELEGGQNKSSFDRNFLDGRQLSDNSTSQELSYVVVRNSGTETTDAYTYYIQMVDEQKNGFLLKNENDLDRADVKVKGIAISGNGAAVAMPASGDTNPSITLPDGVGSCPVELVVR